jgi:ABC-type transporter Mla MlaB component
MLRVQRSVKRGKLTFTLAGRLNAEQVAEMEALFRSEAGNQEIVLDLKDLTLVDRDAVRFLERCEAENIKLKNFPAYIREWITRERGSR